MQKPHKRKTQQRMIFQEFRGIILQPPQKEEKLKVFLDFPVDPVLGAN
jgi:hypothetical protein